MMNKNFEKYNNVIYFRIEDDDLHYTTTDIEDFVDEIDGDKTELRNYLLDVVKKNLPSEIWNLDYLNDVECEIQIKRGSQTKYFETCGCKCFKSGTKYIVIHEKNIYKVSVANKSENAFIKLFPECL